MSAYAQIQTQRPQALDGETTLGRVELQNRQDQANQSLMEKFSNSNEFNHDEQFQCDYLGVATMTGCKINSEDMSYGLLTCQHTLCPKPSVGGHLSRHNIDYYIAIEANIVNGEPQVHNYFEFRPQQVTFGEPGVSERAGCIKGGVNDFAFVPVDLANPEDNYLTLDEHPEIYERIQMPVNILSPLRFHYGKITDIYPNKLCHDVHVWDNCSSLPLISPTNEFGTQLKALCRLKRGDDYFGITAQSVVKFLRSVPENNNLKPQFRAKGNYPHLFWVFSKKDKNRGFVNRKRTTAMDSAMKIKKRKY